jgi:hypothetical protein
VNTNATTNFLFTERLSRKLLSISGEDQITQIRKQKYLSAFLRLVLIIITCFAALWLGDKINHKELALTRITAKVYAPLSGFFYPTLNRDRIVVINYDDEFLKNEGLSWPISYQEHADRLVRLVDEQAKPKAIFLDIYFGQERYSEGLDQLGELLCSLAINGQRLYLAATSAGATPLEIRKGLSQTKHGRRCFELVDVAYTPDPIDRIAWGYHLGTLAKPSPALALAQMEIPEINTQLPMALIWSSAQRAPSVAGQRSAARIATNCDALGFQWKSLLPSVVTNMLGLQTSNQLCPSHQIFSMAQISEMSPEEVRLLVNDRYILIGAQIKGYNDFVTSPAHGLVPGVLLHAMALDNLLTYGEYYKVNDEWRFPYPGQHMVFVGLFAILAMVFVGMFIEYLLKRFQQQQSFLERSENPNGDIKTIAQTGIIGIVKRFIRQLGKFAAWAIRILCMAVAGMWIIVVIVNYSRVGILPIIELIGMTLMAEGMLLSARVDTFLKNLFFGEK